MNKNRIKNRRADAMARKDGVLTAKKERRRQIAQWDRAWLFALRAAGRLGLDLSTVRYEAFRDGEWRCWVGEWWGDDVRILEHFIPC